VRTSLELRDFDRSSRARYSGGWIFTAFKKSRIRFAIALRTFVNARSFSASFPST